MFKFINAIFIVSGTAMGAGLIALPLSCKDIGILPCLLLIIVSAWISYKTACITLQLSHQRGIGTSIVELSRVLSCRRTKYVTLVSFYLLSFALLSVYACATADMIRVFLNFQTPIPGFVIYSLLFYYLLKQHIHRICRINSLFCSALLLCIAYVLVTIWNRSYDFVISSHFSSNILFTLPILLTSFGVQNVCPNIYNLLDGSVKKAQRAFLIGILIPTLIYFLWIFMISNYLRNADFQFFNQMIQGTISPGMLVQKLCSVVGVSWMDTIFKLISLLAILTSAIGIGIGICISLQEEQTKINPQMLVVIIPCIVNLTFQNAFLKILSFGGAIATVFVIFIPIYLKRMKENITLQDTLCCVFGLLIIFVECIDMVLH
ncbi:MAG: hypothetical protein LBF43_03155 [Puniceicoccales bacterium]|nr:hypothetical protein [Puniceicoccales bacterium]